ncbi:uncharacterized protein LOC144062625 [Vanacampus margaritifer]
MYKVPNQRTLMKQLLSATVGQILELFERTIVEYEEELCRTKEENERRQRELLHAVPTPHVRLPGADVQKVLVRYREEEEPAEPIRIKKEDGVWSSEIGEKALKEVADVNMLPLTGVKREDGEAQFSELHHPQSQHGERCEESQADVAPLSDMDEMICLKQPLHFRKEDEDVASCQHADELQRLRHSQSEEPLSQRVMTGAGGEQTNDTSSHSYENRKTNMTHHIDDKQFDCSQCDKTFTTKQGLTMHKVTHSEEKPFVCTVCDKRFSFKFVMVKHMKRHTGVKPFQCLVCARNFFEKSDMIRHMRLHAVEKPSTCPVCAETFVLNADLKQHMRRHGVAKPFACSVCAKQFIKNVELKRHMRTHAVEKSFSCLFCVNRFESLHSLMFHMRAHTKNEENPLASCRSRQSLTKEADGNAPDTQPDGIFAPLSDSDMMSSDTDHTKEPLKNEKKSKGDMTRNDGKTFSCSLCAEKFSNDASLRRHMKTHTDKKSFTCPFCAQVLCSRLYFIKHVRRHAEDKPSTSSSSSQHITEADGKSYSNSECSKPLGKGNLKNSGQKPFVCSDCDKSFSHKRSLRRHKWEKHFSC